jgi:tetratricopeptide (TPR) repeat protein
MFDAIFQRQEPSSAQRGTSQGGAVRAGRPIGGTNAAIPYIISPRNTLLTQGQFTIRWHPIPAAQSYEVKLWRWSYEQDRKEILLWSTTTPETQLVYTQALLLEPGYFYSVEVVTDTGISSELDEGAANARFELLFPEDLAIVQTRLVAWENPDLPEWEQTLLRAGVYFREGLLGDAMALLEPLAMETAEPSVHVALAEVYSYAGLNALAQQQYHQALDLMRETQESLHQTENRQVEAEAIALVGLGEIDATLGNLEQALAIFNQALDRYQILADQTQIAQLTRRIRLIETNLNFNLNPSENSSENPSEN